MQEERTVKPSTSKEEHTPTPWIYQYGAIYDQHGTRIALMDRETPDTAPVERDNNAKFIVRAVNAYVRNALREIGTIKDELTRIEYTLADIADVLYLYPKDTSHPYVKEKLEERDTFLARWTALDRELKTALAQLDD